MAEDDDNEESSSSDTAISKKKKQKQKQKQKGKKGLISRIWNGIFRIHGNDDFEKRLEYITKEEAAVVGRMKRRSLSWRNITRHLIIFSVIFEVIAVGYAIMTTRSMDLDWKMRAFRLLPMFLLPALSTMAYSAFVSFTKMCDRKDQKTLERLRAERQAKIDELKERTNYYTTQQLIQRYDPDPAAKAAAASVLASKLGEDSGLKVYVGDESMLNATTGKSNDVEFVQASGLRNRKQAQTKSSSPGSTTVVHNAEEVMPCSARSEVSQTSELSQLVVEHRDPQSYAKHDGGWIARIAALLVGEDPAQSFALICGNCNMHNGLARKEDFPYISYYCPHCHALNQPKRSDEHATGSPTQSLSSSRSQGSIEAINNANDPAFNTTSDGLVGSDIGKVTEKVALGEPA